MERSNFLRRLQLSTEERNELLARLNEQAPPKSSKRMRDRFDYNVADIAISVQHPQGGESRFLVYGRNISRGGMSVFHGGYVHTGSSCRVVLPQVDGPPRIVAGDVCHCRLILGSCHEIGIRFSEEIDPRQVTGCEVAMESVAAKEKAQGRAVEGTILLAESFDPERRLLEVQLGALGLTVRGVTTPGAVLDAVQREPIDLVLIGLSPVRDHGLRTIERLRAMDFRAPVLLLTAETDPGIHARAAEFGATAIISKPITVDLLLAQLKVFLATGELPARIFSTVCHQPEISPLLRPYVESVRVTTEQIDKAFRTEDIPYLRDLCCRLKGSGCGYGFQELTVAAISALNAVDVKQMADRRNDKIRELIECGRKLQFDENARTAA